MCILYLLLAASSMFVKKNMFPVHHHNMLPVNHHLFLERRKGFLKLPNMHGSIMKKLASKLRPNHGSKTHFLWGLKT
jgi:hypothetical protein